MGKFNVIKIWHCNIHLIFLCVISSFLLSYCISSSQAKAAGFYIIRDAEIENIIQDYTEPLLLAAGLDPASIRIHIVKDNTLNAFVAGGQQIFINTGLIMKSKTASQIIGVLAHEIGHISGGHLIKSAQARNNITKTSILGMLLGGVAIIAGRPDAGTAAIQLGTSIGIQNYLGFSRTQESSADQAALKFLDKSQQSAVGLLEFMEILQDQELLRKRDQDAYVRTHPLSQNRISSIRHHLKRSPFSKKKLPIQYHNAHARIRAKLCGFTKSLVQTLREYPETNSSLEAIYARSIAYYRKPNFQKAIKSINKLIKKKPKDPYFHELKGQIYFENGKIDLALSAYQISADLLPRSALLRTQLAQVQIEKNKPELIQKAINNLLFSIRLEALNPFVWRQLGIAYGRSGKMGESLRALGEEALLQGRNSAAISLAKRAKTQLKFGASDWLRAEDIILAARQNIKNSTRRKKR
jgi:predicted Zn-dependent protease